MSAIDTSPSNNGRGSEAWSGSWTHFKFDRSRPSYLRAHGKHAERAGERDADWPSWYARYMTSEQRGEELPS